jgi:hypothetical protein
MWMKFNLIKARPKALVLVFLVVTMAWADNLNRSNVDSIESPFKVVSYRLIVESLGLRMPSINSDNHSYLQISVSFHRNRS